MIVNRRFIFSLGFRSRQPPNGRFRVVTIERRQAVFIRKYDVIREGLQPIANSPSRLVSLLTI